MCRDKSRPGNPRYARLVVAAKRRPLSRRMLGRWADQIITAAGIGLALASSFDTSNLAGKAHDRTAGDNEMIEHPHTDERERRLKRSGDGLIDPVQLFGEQRVKISSG